MNGTKANETRWGAVFLGWAVASCAGFFVAPLVRALYGAFVGPSVAPDELTATLVVVSLVAGFVSYGIGGYVAARSAGRSGGKHGALTALIGLLFGLALAGVLGLFGAVFAGGVSLPPAGFGLAGAALLAGLVLFLANVFGGFVGGKLGEPAPAEPDAG